MFKRMSHVNELVEQLKSAKWWLNIVDLNRQDKDINIQIREDYINVYYLMGNFMKIELSSKNKIVAKIHRKYIPYVFETKNTKRKIQDYIKLDIVNNDVNVSEPYKTIFNEDVKFITEKLLDKGHLGLIKKEIEKYVGEEKRYQSKLINQNKETILDAEIAVPKEKGNNERPRIDIMHFDKYLRKIVAVEVKVIGDPRLYSV